MSTTTHTQPNQSTRTTHLHDLADELRRQVRGEVRFDDTSRMLYSTDASLYQITPIGVVLPKSVDDIQAVVEIAAKRGLPVLPRGGGSSLSGQAVGAAIVLDFSKYMDKIIGIDTEAQTVTAQPGVTLGVLNRQLAPLGWMIGPDPASAERATVGGCVGNNATGSHSILYGMMADNVLSTSVILADGSRAHFEGVEPSALAAKGRSDTLEGQIYQRIPALVAGVIDDIAQRWPKHWRRASGYNLDRLAAALMPIDERGKLGIDSKYRPAVCDPRRIERFNLAHLMTGSEGTLAVIHQATLQLVRKPKLTALAIVHFDNMLDSCAAITDILECEPSASELLDKQVMDLARKQPEFARRMHFVEGDPEAVLVTEFYGDSEKELIQQIDRLETHLRARGWKGVVRRVIDKAGQNDIWEVRKAGQNLLNSLRSVYKPISGIEDVSVPAEHLAGYIAKLSEWCRAQDAIHDLTIYAHASAGCLHVRPLVNVKTPAGVAMMQSMADFAVDLCVQYSGAMSGEHGDGYSRSALNPRLFGPELYEALRQVKQTFDPQGRMNPGKIVDAPPLTENLRTGPSYKPIELQTVFDWSADLGFAGAIEMCNGAGVCRKIGAGTMCPSYMATRDEHDSTRARANGLRNALAGKLPLPTPSQIQEGAVAENALELFLSEETYGIMDLCLGCKACKTECPSSVDMAKIKAEYLTHYYKRHGLPLFNRLMGWLPELNRLLYRVTGLQSSKAAKWQDEQAATPLLIKLVNATLASSWFKAIQARIGVHPDRTLPTYAAQSLEQWFMRRGEGQADKERGRQGDKVTRRQGDKVTGRQGDREREGSVERDGSAIRNPQSAIRNPVILFHDTWANFNEPQVGQALVRLLEAAGYDVRLAAGRKCCGRPLISGGQADQARAWIDHNVALLTPAAAQGIPIVGIEPSCILTLRDEYLTLASDKKRASMLAQNAYTLEEFIAREVATGRFAPAFKANPGKALLHGHCHHKALVGNESTVAALKLAGYTVEVIASGCCGMAGDFGYEAGHYEVSRTIGEDRLFPAVRSANAETVIVASGTSCRHQIEHFAGRQPVHLAEALAQALL